MDFITGYWDKVSEDERSVLSYLDSIYPTVVDYYGKPTPKRVVMAEKRRFVDRWPIRHTWPHTESPQPRITCDGARPECEISGLRDFDSVNPTRSARSTGTFRYHYEVSFAASTPLILSEDSRVISR